MTQTTGIRSRLSPFRRAAGRPFGDGTTSLGEQSLTDEVSRSSSASGAQVDEVLHIAGGTGQRGCLHSVDPNPELMRVGGHGQDGLDVQLGIAHYSPACQALLADLELRLDHEQQVGVLGGRGQERSQHKSQGDEREIADNESRSGRHSLRIQSTHIGAVENRDALVGLEGPGELPVTDVDRNHMRGSAPKQYIGKAPGGGTGIQATAPFYRGRQAAGVKSIQGAGKFMSTARDVVVSLGRHDLERLRRTDLAGRLDRDDPVKCDMPIGDELGSMRARTGEPAPDEFGVETNESCHAITGVCLASRILVLLVMCCSRNREVTVSALGLAKLQGKSLVNRCESGSPLPQWRLAGLLKTFGDLDDVVRLTGMRLDRRWSRNGARFRRSSVGSALVLHSS